MPVQLEKMAEFIRSGRGAALKKVLEQPLRRPGQHQATEQSTVEGGAIGVVDINIPLNIGFTTPDIIEVCCVG